MNALILSIVAVVAFWEEMPDARLSLAAAGSAAIAAPAEAGSPICPAAFAGAASVTGDGEAVAPSSACVTPIPSPSSVTIAGKPALTVGDKVICPDGRIGEIVGGASSVLVEGKALATTRSRVVGCE